MSIKPKEMEHWEELICFDQRTLPTDLVENLFCNIANSIGMAVVALDEGKPETAKRILKDVYERVGG
jgi:hypothetical protein